MPHSSIPFRLRHTRRRNMALFVYPDGTVEVRAPKQVTEFQARQFVATQRPWVESQMARWGVQPKPPGEKQIPQACHHFGGQITIQIRQGRGTASLEQGSLCLPVTDPHDAERVDKALWRWRAATLQTFLAQRLPFWQSHYEELNGREVTWAIRRMRRRWGSCYARGHIVINTALLQAPLEAIDYVLVHETCHLLEFNHSARFYRLVARAMPDWRERQDRLHELAGQNGWLL